MKCGKKSTTINGIFFTLLPQKKAGRVGGAINSPGIEEALKDVKAITENRNYFFASVFTIAFL